MKSYCYWCAEHKDCRHFEIVKGGRLQRVPFCQKCALYVGKDWNAFLLDETAKSAGGAN